MSIYTSTSKLPKPDKNKPSKPRKDKTPKEPRPAKKVNGWLITALINAVILVLCVLPWGLFRDFFTGAFGLVIYPATICLMLMSLVLAKVKKYTIHRRYVAYLLTIFVLVLMVVQLILTNSYPLTSFGGYLKMTYSTGTTAGGVVLGVIVYPLVKFLGKVGSYITLAIFISVFVSLLIEYVVRQKYAPKKTQISTLDFVPINDFKVPEPVTLDASKAKDKAEIARIKLGLKNSNAKIISSDMPEVLPKKTASRPELTKEYILTPPEPVLPTKPKAEDIFVKSENTASAFNAVKAEYGNTTAQKVEPKTDYSAYTTPKTIKRSPDEINNFNKKPNITPTPIVDNQFVDIDDIDDEMLEEIYDEPVESEEIAQEVIKSASEQAIDRDRMAAEALSNKPRQEMRPAQNQYNAPTRLFEDKPKIEGELIEPVRPEVKPEPIQPKPQPKPYVKPPLTLLKEVERVEADDSGRIQHNIEMLESTLENFKVPAKVIAVTKGPAVTRYELSMPTGVSVKKIEAYADDIAYALASNGSVRIEAPIPGKNAVGIEVPNDSVTPVYFQEIVSSKDFWLRPSPISMALGKDISGNIQYCNLDKLYHVIVAGSTGSGKSVCLNTMLLSMIYKSSPEDLRIILIDPKQVEFSAYEGLPHLLTKHVVTEKSHAINALNWAVKEMERRYGILKLNHVVNIKDYNNLPAVKEGKLDKMQYIVIVIDELADLMSENKREIEALLMRLAQKARASGIHLIVATQRPSVDVITGTIKTNFPSRIAFALTNFADSKTVLDASGAEKLLGKGDMLFKPNDAPEPRRVQGAYVSSEEVNAVVDFAKKNNDAYYDVNIEKEIFAKKDEYSAGGDNAGSSLDPLAKSVLKFFIETNSVSTSAIQRRFSVGFVRAGRIMDQLVYHKFVSQPEGNKPRQVMVALDDLDSLFPDD
ncbi:MAG: hypothetical protein J6C90_02565 [Clostridia bacterium]|nr:hypothetical protein [Clostridia bacterium]